MKLTNKKTGASKHLRRSVATRKFKACNECALKCEEGCENWINDSDKSAPSICAGLGIILVEDSEENTQQNHCEYCGGAPVKNDHSDIDREEFIIYQNEGNLEVYLESNETRESLVGTFKINYCPMCGRKL